MDITVNGKPQTCAADTTLEILLLSLGLNGKRLAVEINLEIIPRSRYAQHALRNGDQIEIVHAIGGGTHTNTRTAT